MQFITSHLLKIFISLLVLVTLFHISIMLKLIPYSIAWGGRLTNDQEMYVFESVSIGINLFLCWILAMKGNWVSFKFRAMAVRIILWIFFVLFILNTIGNFMAKTNFEKCFAVLTALSAFFIWQIQKQNFTEK